MCPRISSAALLCFLVFACAKETRPPVIQTSAGLAATVGALVQLDASGSFDPQDLPLTFEWVFRTLPVGSRATLNDPRVKNPSFVADVPGRFTLELSLSNGIAAAAKTTIVVEVSTCGTAVPTVQDVTSSPTRPGVGDVVQLAVAVDDPDVSGPCAAPAVFRYEWAFVGLPLGSRSTLNHTGVANPSFVADAPGRYGLQVVAIDPEGNRSAPFFREIEANPCGSGVPSAAIQFSPALPTTGDLVALDATVDDPDTGIACGRGEVFAFEWALYAAPARSRAVLSNPALRNPWFEADVAGEYVARLIVTDGAGHRSAPAFVTIATSGCGGAAPVASIAAPATANIGALVALAGSATDADTGPPCGRAETFAYAWSFEATPAGSAARFPDATLASPSFVADVAGAYTVRLTVTDATGLVSGAARARIDVSACGGNRPAATVAASPSPAGVGETVVLTASVSDADIACGVTESFRYAWGFDGLPPGSNARFNSEAIASPSFVPDLAGLYTVRLSVTDASGRTSAPVVTAVNVAACGSNAPVATIAGPTTPSRIGAPVSLAATVTDADAAPPCNLPEQFAYRWSFEALPPGSLVTLNNATARTPSFVPDVEGTYVVRLEVADATRRPAPLVLVSVSVSACGGASPVVAAVAASTSAPNVGQVVRLSATVSDADNDAGCALAQSLSYAWRFTSLPAGSAAALNDARTENPSFVPDVPGDYRATLVVTDSTGRVSTDQSVLVTAGTCGANRPVADIDMISPSIDTESPAFVATGATVQLDGASSSDADNDPPCSLAQALTYEWELFVKPAASDATLSPTLSRTPTFSADRSGTYIVRLRVADGQRTSEVASFEVRACSPFPSCVP
jgi:PKD repeat protein